MRKFQCLLFVLKQSYVLLYNLHDCTFKIPEGIYITLIKSWLMVSFSSKQMWHAIPAKIIIIHAHQFQFL